jgi:hypothetical protein
MPTTTCEISGNVYQLDYYQNEFQKRDLLFWKDT